MPAASQEKIYKAVLNPEGHYSLWPADKENPPGWRDTGKTGTEADCLAYIEEVWVEMRLSKGTVVVK